MQVEQEQEMVRRLRMNSKPNNKNLWLDRLRGMCKKLTKQLGIDERRLHIGTRVERTLGQSGATDLCAGDMRLRNIRHTLNNMGYVRSADQIRFHEAFLQACLPKIYGSDWDLHSQRVMREFNIKQIQYGSKKESSIFVLVLMRSVRSLLLLSLFQL